MNCADRSLAPLMLVEGTPPLGLLALIWPGLAPGRCLHLLSQLLGAAGRDKRPLAADRDPHAFQRIEQDAPPGEPGPELAGVVSRIGVDVWHGIPPITCWKPACFLSLGLESPDRRGNSQITSSGVP